MVAGGMLAAISGAWDAQGVGTAVLFVLLAWTLIRRTTTLDLLSIPSPWGLPLLGHLLQMALHVRNGHEQFLKWHEALGGIVRIRLLHRDVVLVAGDDGHNHATWNCDNCCCVGENSIACCCCVLLAAAACRPARGSAGAGEGAQRVRAAHARVHHV